MSTTVTSVVNHFPSPQNGFTTTLASTIASGAATVPLNSVAGFTNNQIATFVVDPTDATKKQTFTGTVDTSGVQLTGVVWTAGTNVGHSGGATIVDYVTATHMAMVTKGILVNHTQTGSHKTLTDANGNEWLELGTTASAINQVKVTNAAINNGPTIAASGDDTNVNLNINAKGTGVTKVDGFVGQKLGDNLFDFFESGCVWTGDSIASTRNASMTAGVVWIAGKRLTVAAVTARSFTASKDTYVDFTDNGDGTAVPTYIETTNNAASSALTTNGVRNAIITTGATTIAATTNINQGQITATTPLVSAVLTVCDSLGNLIYNCTPVPTVIGQRFITSDVTTTTNTTPATSTLPVIVPAGRRIKISASAPNCKDSGASGGTALSIMESSTVKKTSLNFPDSANAQRSYNFFTVTSPSAGLHTYTLKMTEIGGVGTATFTATALDNDRGPIEFTVELA